MDNIFYNTFHKHNNNYMIEYGITKILHAFETASETDFNDYINYLIDNDEKDEFGIFIYYLLLFRENPHVQSLLNMSNTPVQLIEHLIIFSYGYMAYKGGSADDIYDDLLSFLSQDKIINLLLKSEFVTNDKQMLFFLLTKLNTQHIDEYFKKAKDIEATIKSFMYMPDSAVYNILHRNIDLFNFIVSILPIYVNKEDVDIFCEKYSKEIEIINSINNLIKSLEERTGLVADKKEYDLSRLSIIISLVEIHNIPLNSLNYYTKTKIFNSEFEKLLFYEIMNNSMYKETLNKIRNTKYFNNDDDTNSMIFI